MVFNVDWCDKWSGCPQLRGNLEVGDYKELAGITLSMGILEEEQRPNLVANTERSYSKCKNTLGKIIDHIVSE